MTGRLNIGSWCGRLGATQKASRRRSSTSRPRRLAVLRVQALRVLATLQIHGWAKLEFSAVIGLDNYIPECSSSFPKSSFKPAMCVEADNDVNLSPDAFKNIDDLQARCNPDNLQKEQGTSQAEFEASTA